MNTITRGFRGKVAIWAGIVPGLFIYLFVMVYPLMSSFKYSLYNWRGGARTDFIGFGNYIELFTDGLFWFAFKNNLLVTLFCLIGQLGIALVLTGLLLNRKRRFSALYRTVLFLPVVLSPLVVGFVWRVVYNRNFGLLNGLLRSLGLEKLIMAWLDNPAIVLLMVSIPIIWQYIGFYTIIFLSAASTIDREIFEVAEIDGVSSFKQLWYITFPLIFPTIIVATMLCIAGNMQVFDHIFIMTGGGPGVSSTVMAQYAYQNSFVKFRLGYGNAISIGMFVLSFAVIAVTRYVMRRARPEE